MASVINKDTLQYLTSVNTPDYPDPPWVKNPDLSQVAGVSQQDWKWDVGNNRPISKTSAEIIADALASLNTSADNSLSSLEAANTVDLLRALALVMLDEINLLRVNASLSSRTITQLKAALKGKMI